MENNLKCPIEDVIQFLGQKWTMLLIKFISDNEIVRFNQLLTSFPSISPRTLSKRLKELEERGFIIKQKFNEVPPRVEYSLTKKGIEFGKFFSNFNELILKWEK